MLKLSGIGVSPGVAIGEAFILDTAGIHVPRSYISEDGAEREWDRLQKAIAALSEELAQNRDEVARQLGERYAAIFEAHRQMLEDGKLLGELASCIRDRRYSAEYAVAAVFSQYIELFRKLRGHSLAERAHDLSDLQNRLLHLLVGNNPRQSLDLNKPVVLLAHNLTPSETANLDTRFVRGFATEVGGPSSHTAIVAEALEIPAVVGAGEFLARISPGDLVIVDGSRGEIIINPSQQTLAEYQSQEERLKRRTQKLRCLRSKQAVTRDGTRIFILGNIEFPHEVEHCLREGADGIGLYRTEFLYLSSESEPTEDEHFHIYRQLAEKMEGRPVVVRTFDLGADKLPYLRDQVTEERNPFLGLRSIRLSLRHVPMFRKQLRAILRASVYGDLRVMFPLVTTLRELRQAKMILRDMMEDLAEEGIPFNPQLPVGVMVEVPAVVMLIDQFLEEVDFVSIGTNDLIQYALAVDRSNREVVSLYNATDPAVLRLIRTTITAANRMGKPVSLCGQMSANPVYTMLLIGLGLRQFSVPPLAMPEIKRVCCSVSVSQCEEIAGRAMSLDSAQSIELFLRGELRKAVPESAE
jgi:phosphotransferase system enzyme I (PtsI)